MEQSSGGAYGPHLTIDAYDCPRAALEDFGVIYKFLDRLPGLIDMEKITKPYAFMHLEPGDPEWGITGFVVIATSHISIHTYPERGAAFLDVFSCRYFDAMEVVRVVQETFSPKEMENTVVERGLKFNRAG